MNETPAQVSTALSLALNRSGQNMAPVEPLLKLRDGEKKHESKVQKAVKELYDVKMKHEKSTWDELYSMGQLVALFIQGKQLLQKKPYGAGYYVRPVAGDDTYSQKAMNLMGFYAQACISKVMAANPNVNIRPGDDTPESIASAQDVRPMVDFYESKFYTARFSWREGLHALQNGIYIHRIDWDPFAEGGPVSQYKNVEQGETQLGGGFGECFDCDYAGEAGDFQQNEMVLGGVCPKCGSGAVQVTGAEPQPTSKVSQGDKVNFGEPRITTLPFPACRWDLSKDAEDSTWFIYRQRISVGAIKLLIGDAIIPDTKSSEDIGLDLLHALAYSGQAMNGQSSQDAFKRKHDIQPTMVEFWASPEDYADIQLEGGKTVSGHDLPSGRMSDIYKGPVCFVGLNDMSFLTGIFTEKHCDQIVSGQWLMESDSGAGRGMQDTAAVQRRFNAGDGQLYQGMAASATPAVMTDLRLLKQEQSHYLFQPGKNIDINLSMLPPNFKLGDAFYQGSPGQVSNQYVQYVQTFLRDMFQLSSLVTEFSDGLIGVDNRTATGAQITAALANSLFGPMLMVKGQARVRIAEIVVELHRKHCPVPRYFPGKEGGAGRSVSGGQIKGKLIYELQQDSQLPTTPFTRQTDIRAGIEAMGGIEGVLTLKKADPPMFRKFAADFNWKTEPQDSDAIATLCLARLEQMKQNLTAGVTDPAVLVEQLRPPVSVVEPKHVEKQAWWSEWMDLKDAQEADDILRESAVAMYWKHANFETEKQMPQAANAGMVEAAGAAPMAMGAAALQQQQPEPEQEDKTMEIEADLEIAHSKQDTDLELKRMEGQTQESVARIQGQNAIATTKLAGENAVKTAKAKPRPKPAAKKAT